MGGMTTRLGSSIDLIFKGDKMLLSALIMFSFYHLFKLVIPAEAGIQAY